MTNQRKVFESLNLRNGDGQARLCEYLFKEHGACDSLMKFLKDQEDDFLQQQVLTCILTRWIDQMEFSRCFDEKTNLVQFIDCFLKAFHRHYGLYAKTIRSFLQSIFYRWRVYTFGDHMLIPGNIAMAIYARPGSLFYFLLHQYAKPFHLD